MIKLIHNDSHVLRSLAVQVVPIAVMVEFKRVECFYSLMVVIVYVSTLISPCICAECEGKVGCSLQKIKTYTHNVIVLIILLLLILLFFS